MVKKGPNFKNLSKEIPIVFREEMHLSIPEETSHFSIKAGKISMVQFIKNGGDDKIISHYKSENSNRRFILNPVLMVKRLRLAGCDADLGISHIVFTNPFERDYDALLSVVAVSKKEKRLWEWEIDLRDIKGGQINFI